MRKGWEENRGSESVRMLSPVLGGRASVTEVVNGSVSETLSWGGVVEHR